MNATTVLVVGKKHDSVILYGKRATVSVANSRLQVKYGSILRLDQARANAAVHSVV